MKSLSPSLDADQPPIIFVYDGQFSAKPFPRYLCHAIEQARVSNPAAKIFVITERTRPLPENWRVVQVLTEPLKGADYETFCTRYYHVSTNPAGFEKFCFLRWFYICAFMEKEELTEAVCLDGDLMLFVPTTALMKNHAAPAGITACYNGSPHCAMVRGSLKPLLKFFIEAFDPARRAEWEARMERALQSGGSERWVLSDMFMIKEYLVRGGIGAFYPCDPNTSGMMLDESMSASNGVEVWPGAKVFKRVFWQVENSRLIPCLKRSVDGVLVRAGTLHFYGAGKRKMRRFNRLTLCLQAINRLRAAWFSHYPPINLLPRLLPFLKRTKK